MRRSTRSNLIRLAWAVVLALIVFGLFYVQECGGQDVVPVYLVSDNIFADCFNEPVETIIFISNSGRFYALTNLMVESVTFIYEEFEELLKKDGLQMKDMMCIIHNHIDPSTKFTLADKKSHSFLKNKGFNGWFLLWSSLRQKVVDIIPPEVKNDD